MSQRDCGCPGLVTPTLDELLAVARQKPLPRVRVRERRAPPARVGATLKGWMEWRLVDRRGREVAGGEGPNLILDQGLDEVADTAIVTEQGGTASSLIGSYFPIIRYAAIGTDSSSPTTSDTGLGAEVARTDTTFATETITRPSPGVYQLTRFIEFDYSIANGNLTEWGFSSSASAGSNLFNRALFTDSEGNPDTVTKTSEEKLRLTYTLEIALSPVTLTAGSFTITGIGTVNGDYMLIGGAAPSTVTSENMRCVAADLKVFSGLARGDFSAPSLASPVRERNSRILLTLATDQSGITYTATGGAPGSDQLIADALGATRDAYVTGSFQRTGGAWKFDTGTGNLDPIKGFGISIGESYNSGLSSCTQYGYVFDLDLADEFSKDNEHSLTIGVPTVTWGRAS